MSETSSTAQEGATENQIKDLLRELTESQQSFDVWRATESSDLEQRRNSWLAVKDRLHAYDPEALFAWKSREPGLAEKAEVVATKRRITELQAELTARTS
jgi:hypothetical protein